jgi:uncharacterized protein (DUF305 family)
MKYILAAMVPLVFVMLARPVFAAGADGKASIPEIQCSDPEPQAFATANLAMLRGLERPVTGDADHDFAAMMIPHHQWAVDMAKIELSYGHDPALRALAARILNAQKPEAEQLQSWLKTHPLKSQSGGF